MSLVERVLEHALVSGEPMGKDQIQAVLDHIEELEARLAEEVDELRAKLEAAELRASKLDAAVGVALTAISAPIGLGLIGLAVLASIFDKDKKDA